MEKKAGNFGPRCREGENSHFQNEHFQKMSIFENEDFYKILRRRRRRRRRRRLRRRRQSTAESANHHKDTTRAKAHAYITTAIF